MVSIMDGIWKTEFKYSFFILQTYRPLKMTSCWNIFGNLFLTSHETSEPLHFPVDLFLNTIRIFFNLNNRPITNKNYGDCITNGRDNQLKKFAITPFRGVISYNIFNLDIAICCPTPLEVLEVLQVEYFQLSRKDKYKRK